MMTLRYQRRIKNRIQNLHFPYKKVTVNFILESYFFLTANATEAEKRDLKNELEIMATAGKHPNLVSLLGACTETGR